MTKFDESFLNQASNYELNTSIFHYFVYSSTRIWGMILSGFHLSFCTELTKAMTVIYNGEEVQVVFLRRNRNYSINRVDI